MPSPTPLTDLTQVREMLGADAASLLPELIGIYLRNAHELSDTMAQTLAVGDAPALRQAAHALKGSSGIYGAQALVALCQEVEDAAIVGALAGLAAKLAQVNDQLAQVEMALRQETG